MANIIELTAVPKRSKYITLPSEVDVTDNTYELGSASTWKNARHKVKTAGFWKQNTSYTPVHSSVLDSIPQRKTFFKSGWQVGASSMAALAIISLIMNLGATILVLKRFPPTAGISSVYTGSCETVERYNKLVHLLINAVSTALLSGSNYCMQVLCAPNRNEVDKAHAGKKYMDIGVPSLRNLKLIRKKKLVLWCCLGLSSLPLHLIYNSMFFNTLNTNDYNIYYATEGFLKGDDYDRVLFPDGYTTSDDTSWDTSSVQHRLQNESSEWKKLSNSECISDYAVDVLSTRRDVVVIISQANSTNGSLAHRDPYQFDIQWDLDVNEYFPYPWLCNDSKLEEKFAARNWDWARFQNPRHNDVDCYLAAPLLATIADQWSPSNFDAQYCMSEVVEGKCRLSFSFTIAVVVMLCNVVKICCMGYVAWGIRDSPLITMGDAVASFTRRRDDTTRGVCLATSRYFRQHWNGDENSSPRRMLFFRNGRFAGILGGHVHPVKTKPSVYGKKFWDEEPESSEGEPQSFDDEPHRLHDVASAGRWFGTVGLLFIALMASIGLLAYGVVHLRIADKSISVFWAMGFGTVREASMIGGPGWYMPSITAAVIVANLPQVVLSLLYLLFNSVLSAMLAAHEWSHYAHQRKPLRVSTPRGLQRSTYFLSLPYRFAVPLLVLSGTLHWLVSQSLFLANITNQLHDGEIDAEYTVSTCGYSPLAMILTLCVGSLMLFGIVGSGYWRVSTNMPLVGSCSAAISAACHLPPGQENAHLRPLQWGVIPGEDEEKIGHCSFSAEEVEAPVKGRKYA